MLFEEAATALEAGETVKTDETIIGNALLFDWGTQRLVMEDGTPVLVMGKEAVKTWLELLILTRPGKYGAYPDSFGCTALDLIGQKLPRGYALAELRREVAEAAALCPGIQEVSDFSYDGEKISFQVTLEDQTTEVMTVGT